MSYQKKNIQKINNSNSSISEAVAMRKGFSFPAVPALQRQGEEEELQMKNIPAQLMEDEELLQGKFETIQKAEEEELIQGKFETIQKVEEEEPLQGKFETIQKVEEEEPLQGKFETVQRVEEEEPLQGKFETIQRVEEEEPLQGKFETIQRVEEEEPLQGKFQTIQKVEEEEPLQGKFETVQKVEEEEPLQGKFETVQKVEEEEPLQGKFETIQRVEEEEPLQGKFETVQKVEVPKNTNQNGLPGNLKSGIEQLSGYSMDDVKVHYNSSQPAQLQALAYAQGTDIHIAPGQEKHLPHEAWHVAQQKQGRVQPTLQMKAGVPVNDDAGLENEADVMGAKALQNGNQLSTPLQRMIADITKSNSGGIIQRVITTVPERYTPLEKAKQQNPSAPITTTSEEKTDSAAAEVEPSVVEETSGSAGNEAIKKADASGRKRRDAVSETRKPALGKNGEHITDMGNMLPNWIVDEDFDVRKRREAVIEKEQEYVPKRRDAVIEKEQEYVPKRRDAVIEKYTEGITGMWQNSKTFADNVELWEKLKINEDKGFNIKKVEKLSIGSGVLASVGENSSDGNTAEVFTDAGKIAGKAGEALASGQTKDIVGGYSESKNLLNKNLPKDELEADIGEITQSIAEPIKFVFEAVILISKLKDEEKVSAEKGLEVTASLGKTLQSGAKTAIEIMQRIEQKVPKEVAETVPGLGLAVSACSFIIDSLHLYDSKKLTEKIGEEEIKEKSELNTLLKTDNIADFIPGIFSIEERGVVLHKKNYGRLKPYIMEELQNIDNQGRKYGANTTSIFKDWCNKYGISTQLGKISFNDFYDAVVSYETVSKLTEINEKRKGYSINSLVIDTINIAANIAKLIPADLGITASALTATAAIGSLSLKGGKFIQSKVRNLGILGGDITRSEENKNIEYVQLVRNIYHKLSKVSDLSETEELGKIEVIIKATGANLDNVYALNGDENQIKLLIKSVKEGR